MLHNNEYNEEALSQIPALELLQHLGYSYLSPAEAQAQRGTLYHVILKDVLRERLEALNRFEYKGTRSCFSAKNIEQAMQDLDEPLGDGLLKTNEKIFDRLELGESYPLPISQVEGGLHRTHRSGVQSSDCLAAKPRHCPALPECQSKRWHSLVLC